MTKTDVLLDALRITVATLELHTGNGCQDTGVLLKDENGDVDYEAAVRVARNAIAQAKPPVTTRCDICQRPVGKVYVDGRTTAGIWATMCKPCHRLHGVGLGTGKGQQFDASTGKKLAG